MIAEYDVELNSDKLPYLVQVNSFNSDYDELSAPVKIVNFMNEVFNLHKRAEEHIFMIALNIKCAVLGIFEISHGTVSLAVTSPREVYMRALLCGASQIILIHNHPSGDCSPSKEDTSMFRRYCLLGNTLNIILTDYIIIGDNAYISFMEEHIG